LSGARAVIVGLPSVIVFVVVRGSGPIDNQAQCVVLVLRQAQDEDQIQARQLKNLILSLSKDEVFISDV